MQTNIRLTGQPPGCDVEMSIVVAILNCELPAGGQRVTGFWSLAGQSYFGAQAAPAFANLTPCWPACRDFPVFDQ